MRRIRVALADDHPIVLAGIRALLQGAPDIILVGEAKTGAEALRLITETAPDVAVIDLSMPELTGPELATQLASTMPDVRILALTVHEDRAYVQPLLKAGARGYLLKRSAAEDLGRAIRAIADGGVYLDPAIADRALSDTHQASPSSGVEQLSDREREVLQLTAQGFSNKEAAARLDISVKSVETYRARGAGKLGLRTRAEIVRYAMRQGWLKA